MCACRNGKGGKPANSRKMFSRRFFSSSFSLDQLSLSSIHNADHFPVNCMTNNKLSILHSKIIHVEK